MSDEQAGTPNHAEVARTILQRLHAYLQPVIEGRAELVGSCTISSGYKDDLAAQTPTELRALPLEVTVQFSTKRIRS